MAFSIQSFQDFLKKVFNKDPIENALFRSREPADVREPPILFCMRRFFESAVYLFQLLLVTIILITGFFIAYSASKGLFRDVGITAKISRCIPGSLKNIITKAETPATPEKHGNEAVKQRVKSLLEYLDFFLIALSVSFVALSLSQEAKNAYMKNPGKIELSTSQHKKHKSYEVIIISTLITTMAVSFVSMLLGNEHDIVIIYYGTAIGLVIAALSLFLLFSGKESTK